MLPCVYLPAGNAADLPTATEFVTRMVDAADAIGVPLCFTLSVVSADGSKVLREQQYHTGTQV